MAQVTLVDEEVEALRVALARLVVRERTGELGVLHGLDRFVGASECLRKPQRAALASVYRNLNLGLRVVDK